MQAKGSRVQMTVPHADQVPKNQYARKMHAHATTPESIRCRWFRRSACFIGSTCCRVLSSRTLSTTAVAASKERPWAASRCSICGTLIPVRSNALARSIAESGIDVALKGPFAGERVSGSLVGTAGGGGGSVTPGADWIASAVGGIVFWSAGTGIPWRQILQTTVRPRRKSANSNSRPHSGQMTRTTIALPLPNPTGHSPASWSCQTGYTPLAPCSDEE
jgi:hypothetical protein